MGNGNNFHYFDNYLDVEGGEFGLSCFMLLDKENIDGSDW